jgi:hypothetical protein
MLPVFYSTREFRKDGEHEEIMVVRIGFIVSGCRLL